MGFNPNCDGAHCLIKEGEVRLLPYGGGGNIILCLDCFRYEMSWRQRENIESLDKNNPPKFPNLPKWEDLKVYTGG